MNTSLSCEVICNKVHTAFLLVVAGEDITCLSLISNNCGTRAALLNKKKSICDLIYCK